MTIIKTLGKGQVVIPKAVREQLHIHPGQKLTLQVEDARIVLQPLPDNPIRALRGILKGKGPSTTELLKERGEERLHEERKIARRIRPH